MADVKLSSLAEAPTPSASLSTVLQDLITDHYAFRGTIWKCPSPIDFAPAPEHPAMLARATAIYLGSPTASSDEGRVLLMDTLTGLVQDTSAFVNLSSDLRDLLISGFSSAIAVALEAGTHAPYAHSPTNSAAAFYALLLAVRQEPGGQTILDRWAAANILPAMTSAMARLVGRECLLDAIMSNAGAIEVSSADRASASASRKQRVAKLQTRPHKRARQESFDAPHSSRSVRRKQVDNSGSQRTTKLYNDARVQRQPLLPKRN